MLVRREDELSGGKIDIWIEMSTSRWMERQAVCLILCFSKDAREVRSLQL